LHDLYDQCSFGVQQPTVEALHRTLFDILAKFQDAYLIIDALDECVNQIKLLHWIKEIVGRKIGKLHILATGDRNETPCTRPCFYLSGRRSY
jgi:hypothetical protein